MGWQHARGDSALGLALASVLAAWGCGLIGGKPVQLGSFELLAETAPSSPVSVTPRIYWAQGKTGSSSEHGTVGEANSSGTELEQSLVTGTTGGADVASNSQYIYWANYGIGTIGRADLDGSHVDQRFITGASDPVGVAVNSRYIYWTDSDSEGTIGRADLDGSQVDQHFLVAAFGWGVSITGLAVNRGHIYWADVTSNEIGRADLDGGGVEEDFISGANAPDGVAVNTKYVYWSNSGDDTIGRALLDGSHIDQHCVVPDHVPIGNEPEAVATDGQYVYWTNYPADAIGRADLDGTDVVARFIPANGVPEGVAVGGSQQTVPVNDGSCTRSSAPILLGFWFPKLGVYAVGWGEAAPPTLSNGGASANGTISDIIWSSWGGAVAQGQGLNPIYKPGGGYYPKPAVIQLRLSSIRRCTPRSPLSYTTLMTREQTVPGGPLGPWPTAAANLCKGEGI